MFVFAIFITFTFILIISFIPVLVLQLYYTISVADRPAKNIPLAEKTVGTGQDKGIRQYADAPAERVSLKAKLEVMKAKVAGGDTEKPMPLKAKGKEETL